MPLPTFGFEAEYANNVGGLARLLHNRGYAQAGDLHRYHCGCDSCHFGIGGSLRFQTDSSCGGEAISNVRSGSPFKRENRLLFESIQQAALDADAEPSLDAGFHVHVDRRHLSSAEKRQVVWQFYRYEPVLVELASGLWSFQRGNNSRLRVIHGGYRSYVSGEAEFDVVTNFYDSHLNADRHSNLNIATNHTTFEFRLWNATRSAWRMQLHCGVSQALMDPRFWRRVTDAEIQREPVPLSTFVSFLPDRVKELAERQMTYRQALLDSGEDSPGMLTRGCDISPVEAGDDVVPETEVWFDSSYTSPRTPIPSYVYSSSSGSSGA